MAHNMFAFLDNLYICNIDTCLHSTFMTAQDVFRLDVWSIELKAGHIDLF